MIIELEHKEHGLRLRSNYSVNLDIFIWLLFIILFWYLGWVRVVVTPGVDGYSEEWEDGCWYGFGEGLGGWHNIPLNYDNSNIKIRELFFHS